MKGDAPAESDLARYTFTFPVTIGELHPNAIPTRADAERRVAEQTALLNKCLKYGRIIAKTQSSGIFAVGESGEHQLATSSVTFIVGFARKPYWLPDRPESEAEALPLAAVRE